MTLIEVDEKLTRDRHQGLITMREWFWWVERNTAFETIEWISLNIGVTNTMSIVNYLNKKISGGWGSDDRDKLNDIRELYLMNKDVESVKSSRLTTTIG